jgi:Domain of unknown function (DUF4160)
MPTILRVGTLRIAILTRNEHEPPHVHVEHPDGTIVVFLDEKSRSARLREKSRNVKPADVRNVVAVVDRNFNYLLAAWERIHR